MRSTSDKILSGAQCRLARRDELGISQQQLAKDAGVSRSYITNFEGGVFEPTDKVKQKLRSYFEEKGVDFDAASGGSDSDASAAAPRPAAQRAGRLRGVECVYVSGKLANETQRDRILERTFAIRERLAEIAAVPVKRGFLDEYNENTDDLLAEARALIAEIGLLYGRLFGFEFAAVPTADMLFRKASPVTVADALGLVFRDVFAALNLRRNSKRATGDGEEALPGADDESAPEEKEEPSRSRDLS
jgi:transcriptional regulator with XRE-family HTH domain